MKNNIFWLFSVIAVSTFELSASDNEITFPIELGENFLPTLNLIDVEINQTFSRHDEDALLEALLSLRKSLNNLTNSLSNSIGRQCYGDYFISMYKEKIVTINSMLEEREKIKANIKG